MVAKVFYRLIRHFPPGLFPVSTSSQSNGAPEFSVRRPQGTRLAGLVGGEGRHLVPNNPSDLPAPLWAQQADSPHTCQRLGARPALTRLQRGSDRVPDAQGNIRRSWRHRGEGGTRTTAPSTLAHGLGSQLGAARSLIHSPLRPPRCGPCHSPPQRPPQ